jgi:hypothetical protein
VVATGWACERFSNIRRFGSSGLKYFWYKSSRSALNSYWWLTSGNLSAQFIFKIKKF